MKILWICFVWPEPNSSAAGVRTVELIDMLCGAGHEVRVCSPCQSNLYQESLEQKGILTQHLLANDPDFDTYLSEYRPDIVFFDRFIIEEQFAWRVKAICPSALRILDSIDLHSLRRSRQRKVESNHSALELSSADLQSDDAIREVASIYRCDLTLIISDFEISLLKDYYNIPDELITLCRFSYPEINQVKSFDQRSNFVAIGNFNHAPNLDSFKLLHDNLWPKIKIRLKKLGVSDVELHIYGAYPKNTFLDLDDKLSGFRILGRAGDVRETLSKYRLNLAALRFGAGIKGKISDGWSVGTPCVATSIAAEGMHEGLPFGGCVEDDCDRYAEQAVNLYVDCNQWQSSQDKAIKIINSLFNLDKNHKSFISAIESAINNISENRQRNFIGQILWHQQHRSTEFFSRWIEVKNQLVKKQ